MPSVVNYLFLTQINHYENNLSNISAISEPYGECPK